MQWRLLVRLLFILPLLHGCAPDANAQPLAPLRRARNVVERAPGAWEARCIASSGCPAPTQIPRCSADLRSISFEEVIAQRRTLTGHRVSVRGGVRASAGTTQRGCPDRNGVQRCCNRSFGGVFLTGASGRSTETLGLGTANARAFPCQGDESGLCCSVELSTGEIVATGVLRAPPYGGEVFLESPVICRL